MPDAHTQTSSSENAALHCRLTVNVLIWLASTVVICRGYWYMNRINARYSKAHAGCHSNCVYKAVQVSTCPPNFLHTQ